MVNVSVIYIQQSRYEIITDKNLYQRHIQPNLFLKKHIMRLTNCLTLQLKPQGHCIQ